MRSVLLLAPACGKADQFMSLLDQAYGKGVGIVAYLFSLKGVEPVSSYKHKGITFLRKYDINIK